MKEIEFDYILQWWLREPQPPGMRASATGKDSSGTVSFFSNISQWWLREPQPPKPPRMRVSGTVSFLWLREPQPPKPPRSRATATVSFGFECLSHRERVPQPPFRLASRASATEITGNESRNLGYFKSL